MDSTHDAELGVTPALLLRMPHVDEAMDSAGLEPASQSRPGVWGLKSEHGMPLNKRLTIDLIAPASVSGTGRRSADVGVHGRRSVSKTVGTELSLVDREWMKIESFDDPAASREGYVAGVAALICAKSFKISDRLDPTEIARNPQRFNSKDVTDLFRLMIAKDGAVVRAIFDIGDAAPEIADTVTEGKRRLLALYARDDGRWIADQVVSQWGEDVFSSSLSQHIVDKWLAAFTQ
jgi:hypothetical protein